MLGIDYGTTNSVAVVSDRGRYPIVPHLSETGIGTVAREVFPSLIVVERSSGRRLFGSEAERVLVRPGAEARYGVIPSLKRRIRDYAVGARIAQDAVEGGLDPADLLRDCLAALGGSIRRSSMFAAGEPLEAVIAWPANANGAQRYLTRRCFREAGFEVQDAISEPAAAAVEFADRVTRGNRMEARRLVQSIGVFDLGGGTFDVSLVRIEGSRFTVVASAGIERLGGDDFDDLLARLFAERLGTDFGALRPFQQCMLRLHARRQKESIGEGGVKSLTLVPSDVGLQGNLCCVSVADYFAALRPAVEPAVEKLTELLGGEAAREAGMAADTLDAVYLVGGSSRLPLVPKQLARRFPAVKLIMTDKPFSSTAMGAAIRGTEGLEVRDVLSRTFGVLRLTEAGAREVFAPVFPAGTRLPQAGEPPIRREIVYAPHHNIGHLRYLECAAIGADGRPAEGVRRWSDVRFPYDPAVRVGTPLEAEPIHARADLDGHAAVETYTCDADGVITVSIRRECDGQAAAYEIFRS